MGEGISRVPRISPSGVRTQQAAAARSARQASVAQEAAQEAFTEWAELSAFNPLAISRRSERLDDKLRRKSDATTETDQNDENNVRIEGIKKSAEELAGEHPDLDAQDLIDFLKALENGENVDALKKFGDPTLADIALSFAQKHGNDEAKEAAKRAQEKLIAELGREVKAGHNVASEVYNAAVLGTPSYLRDLYRDATGQFLSANDLFKSMLSKFSFGDMARAIEFLLKALGADLNAEGPSIDIAQLKSIFNDCQSLQGILGVYTFFYKRMYLLAAAFKQHGLPMPHELNFEQMSEAYMRLIDDKYPSSIKVFNFAPELGLNNELIGQSLAFSQMRDATRQTSLKLYKDEQHRRNLQESINEAIDEIERQLDEEEEEGEGDEYADGEQEET